MSISQSASEEIALKCLDWLAGNDELWPVFLGSTGADETSLKGRIEDPDLLGAVLDFILMDDDWVRRCADNKDLPPSALIEARTALPGGAAVHWT